MNRQEFPYLSEYEYFQFPPIEEGTPEGIVASGGNLSPGMLISAYSQGIFPWFSEGEPILWWSPDPRFVLFPKRINISGSMKKILKKDLYSVTLDRAFGEIIRNCRHIPREGQEGTWITEGMEEAYNSLHRIGYAHSVEVWEGESLAGGLYGVSLGRCFFGESMFSRRSNASKTALIYLAAILLEKGFHFIDSQVYTPHLSSMGAEDIPRKDFLRRLKAGLDFPSFKGDWNDLFPRRKTSEILR